MDFTMGWIQPIKSPKCKFIFVLLVGILLAGVNGTTLASPAVSVFMTNSVIQAKEDGKSATEQADSLYKLARKEVRSGNVERGKTLLQQVLALDPQHRQAQADMNKLLASGDFRSPRIPL